MQFKKILFHTRFREHAFNSLQAVLALKAAGLQEVVLTHVVPRDEVAFVPFGGYLREEGERLQAGARKQFEEWQATISAQGVASKIRVEVGILNAKILEIAAEEKVDLIVAGPKKRGLAQHIYVGMHILDLLRRSPLPVLWSKHVVEFEAEGQTRTRVNDHFWERPMLATDWSQPSAKARAAVASLKGAAQSAIVAHVIDEKLTKGRDAHALQELEAETRRRLESCCRELKDAGIEAEPCLAFGKSVPEVIRLSREHQATMIVLGKTGKDWFQQYFMGGVSHRIAEASELPVMVVP
jgi:nucleotide-binding universal stress UspA family protein